MIRIAKFEHLIVPASATIRTVLARIDAATPELFQIVVDDGGRVIATVTDGDVRRAMLKGVGLDDSVAACMHTDPIVGKDGEAAENARKVRQTRFLPVLDAAGRLVHVLSLRRGAGGIGPALVMAGGFGKRLGEATKDTPKPLIHVGGRPMIDRVMAGLEDAGVPGISVAVHYLAEQIDRFVAARENRVPVSIIRENDPLGTAGALGLLPEAPDRPVLVVNADLVTHVDFAALHEFHERHGFDGTVAAARYEIQVPFGVLRYGQDGLIAGIDEKPVFHHFVAAGIYYLSPEIVSLVPRNRPIDMPQLLDDARRIGLKIGIFPIHEYWRDVGRPHDLLTVEAEMGAPGK